MTGVKVAANCGDILGYIYLKYSLLQEVAPSGYRQWWVKVIICVGGFIWPLPVYLSIVFVLSLPTFRLHTAAPSRYKDMAG